MRRGAIIDEMKPKGVLRPIIVELIRTSGAYVIVSGSGSTSSSALASRRQAITEALEGIPDSDRLTVDFYDRNRIATWVRDHIGLIPWVRSRIGKSISGWRSYGSWSRTPAGVDASYFADAAARIRTGSKDDGEGLSAIDGINKIRDVLRTPGTVARLVGLSGVGKTRLVEAIFDPSVGTNSLDSSVAIYTDVADGPSPQLAGFLSDLIGEKRRAIVVVDNCPPDVHRQLSAIVRAEGATVSLITIEYDIREDQPEGTDVFSLGTSSPELIERLVSKRCPELSQVDSRTIADFSGGNARIALALAGTIGKSETIAGLTDEDLFHRLFQQRHGSDNTLMSLAEACSLVYSFEGENLAGTDAELPILASLVGRDAADLFAASAELKRRDLMQERGPWRAVLPHAIANRLAKRALQNIPTDSVLQRLVEHAPARLLRSFSRRLGYLDGSKEAKAIVEAWLAPAGMLADPASLNELGRSVFTSVAPVAPEATLSVLERVLDGADEPTLRACTHFAPLLRSLAYDPGLFERAVSFLARLVRFQATDGPSERAADILTSLFLIVMSVTHAPVDLRLKVVAQLLTSGDQATRALGVSTLHAMLKTDFFSSSYSFEFGARSRDFGYEPKTADDVSDWFTAVLKCAESFALADEPIGASLRTAIASEVRGLWHREPDQLERTCQTIATKGFWRDGWVAVRETRIYDGKWLPEDLKTRLMTLEDLLRPRDLVDRIRGIVIGSKGLSGNNCLK